MDLPVELPGVITTIAAVLAPVIIQLVGKKISSELGRFYVALLFSAVTGFIAMLIEGKSLAHTPETIVFTFTYASIAYKTLWKPLWEKKEIKTFKAEPTTYALKKVE